MYTIDFETRSAFDIRRGVWLYSKNNTTRPICCAGKMGDMEAHVYIDPYFERILEAKAASSARGNPEDGHFLGRYERILSARIDKRTLIKNMDSAKHIIAHNAAMEICILKHQFGIEYDIGKWICTMAMCANANLPLDLKSACENLELSNRKNMAGSSNMLKISLPKKISQGQPEWNDDANLVADTILYCIDDVEAEHELYQCLVDTFPDYEQRVWEMDQDVNFRGIHVDINSIHALSEIVEDYKKWCYSEFTACVNDVELKRPTQTVKLLRWLQRQGINVKKVDQASLNGLLESCDAGETTISDAAYRACRLRLDSAKVSKANAFLGMLDSEDCGVRLMFFYSSASTGRWSSKGVQLHNLKRKTYTPNETKLCTHLLRIHDYETVNMLFDAPPTMASKMVRSVITPRHGNIFICGDFSSIESRVLPWLADDQDALEVHRSKKCPYCTFASKIHGRSYVEVYEGYKANDPVYLEMRYEGKTGELACGYQGGESSVKNFAPKMPIARRRQIVKLWRENRPATVNFWHTLNKAAVHTVKTGEATKVNKLIFRMVKIRDIDCLTMRLPSGRLIHYNFPWVSTHRLFCYKIVEDAGNKKDKATGDGSGGSDSEEIFVYLNHCNSKVGDRVEEKDFDAESVTFSKYNQSKGIWEFKHMYGGKFAHHATQGTARDIQAECLCRLRDNGFPIVLHIHDEYLIEVKDEAEKVSAKQALAKSIAEERPIWAKDLPIESDGWVGYFYRK